MGCILSVGTLLTGKSGSGSRVSNRVGGAVLTNNPDLATRIRKPRAHGSLKRSVHSFGFNSRLDEMHAAVLSVNLRQLHRWNDLRREEDGTVYYFYSNHLGTARVMTNAAGQVQQESTYYPFGGEQRVITNTVDNRYKFI